MILRVYKHYRSAGPFRNSSDDMISTGCLKTYHGEKSAVIRVGGKRKGQGPRNDVLTTCKALTPRGGQWIIAVFFPQ